LLPAWRTLLEELKLPEKLMPRDIKTRWNSTFTMLDFAVAYRKALDLLSGDRANGLRELELKEDEWRIVVQLRDVLKVKALFVHVSVI
jgi:hypothetical protein